MAEVPSSLTSCSTSMKRRSLFSLMTTLEKEGSQPEEKEEAWNISHFLKETTAVEKIRWLSEYEKLPNLNEKWRKGKSSVLF